MKNVYLGDITSVSKVYKAPMSKQIPETRFKSTKTSIRYIKMYLSFDRVTANGGEFKVKVINFLKKFNMAYQSYCAE